MIAIIDYKAGNLTSVVKALTCLARALREASSRDERKKDLLPSTKGLL